MLNSLAKGLPEHTASLVTAGVLPVLWEQLEICDNFNDQKSLGVKHCLLNKTNDTFEECSEPLTAVNNTKLTQAINKYTSKYYNELVNKYTSKLYPVSIKRKISTTRSHWGSSIACSIKLLILLRSVKNL